MLVVIGLFAYDDQSSLDVTHCMMFMISSDSVNNGPIVRLMGENNRNSSSCFPLFY